MSTWTPLVAVCLTLALASDGTRNPCDVNAWLAVRRTGDPVARFRFASRCTAIATQKERVFDAIAASSAWRGLGDFDQARAALLPFATWHHPYVALNLGALDAREGRKPEAIQLYRDGLERTRAIKSPAREFLALHLASELVEVSEFEEALRTLSWLDSIRGELLEPTTEPQVDALMTRALVRIGDFSAAERELERAHARGGSSVAGASAFTLLTEGQVRMELGQLASAEVLLTEAREAAAAEHNRMLQAYALSNLGWVSVHRQDWPRVRGLVTEARALAAEGGADLERTLELQDGIAAREMGELATALKEVQHAATLHPPPLSSWQIPLELGRVFERLGDQAAARSSYETSISDIEVQRRRLERSVLQDWLMDKRREPYEALFGLHANQGNATLALAVLERFLSYRLVEDVAAVSASAASRPLESLRRAEALLDLASAETQLSRGGPTRKRGAVAAFVTASGSSWRLVVANGSTTVSSVALPPAELCAAARRFAESPDDDGVAALLGASLLPSEVLKQLGARFSVVPPLCAPNLPVAALLVAGQRLVESHIVTLAPSVATALPAETSDSTGAGVLVLGDPLGDLPSAREEATEVALRFGEQPVLGPAATRERFLDGTSRSLLHVAAHLRVETTGPVLVLADGPVSISDVVRLRLAPRLVVLASCHSGARGESSPQETMATAFLRAGSHSVLATFKSIEDVFAARVVRAFYEAGGRRDPAGALAKVQRSLSRTEPTSRWSAFYVAGSPDAGAPPEAVAQKAASRF